MKLSHIAASIITRLIPRSRDILVFSSFPDYTDNAYAVYEYFQKNRGGGEYKYVWIFSDKASATKYLGIAGFTYGSTVRALFQ